MSFKKGELKKLLIEIGGEISGDMRKDDLVQAIRVQLTKKETPASVDEKEEDEKDEEEGAISANNPERFPMGRPKTDYTERGKRVPTVRELTFHGPGTHFPRSV